MKLRFLSLGLIICCFSNIFADVNWTRTGMGGGGTISMIISTKVDGSTLVAASDNGGLYISNNFGESWNVLGANNNLNSSSFHSLAVDPSVTTQGQKFYAGSVSGLYVTENGGTSFTKQTDLGDSMVESIAVAKSNPNVVYIAQNDWSNPSEIYRTNINTGEWELASNLSGNQDNLIIVKLLVHPTHPEVVYALTGKSRYRCSAARLYRSDNGGDSWSRVATNLPTPANSAIDILDVDVDPSNPSIFYISTFKAAGTHSSGCQNGLFDVNMWDYAGQAGSFYKININTNATTKIIDKTGIISVGTGANGDPSTTIRLVDYLFENGTSINTNGGTGNWGFHDRDDPNTGWERGYTYAVWNIFISTLNGLSKSITKDVFNGNRLYHSMGQGAGISTDGGIYFKSLVTKKIANSQPQRWSSTGLGNLVLTALDVSDSDPNQIYAGGYDVGFWASNDHGLSWIRKQPDYNEEANRKYVWPMAIPSNSAIIGAKHGDGANILSIISDPAHKEIVWATFSRDQSNAKAGVFKSSNSGNTWTLAKIYKNNVELTFDETIRVHGLSLDKESPESNRVLYVTVDGDVYKSTDGGLVWNDVFLLNGANNNLKFTAVGKTNSGQKVVYAGGEGGLYRSINGGNWLEVGTPEMKVRTSQLPIHKDIIPTYPSTKNNVTTNPWEGVFDIAITPDGKVYATVYGSNRGLYRSDSGNSGTWELVFPDNYMRGVTISPQNPDLIFVTSSEEYASGMLSINSSSGLNYSNQGGDIGTWHEGNSGMAWNFGGKLEIESGTNPSIWLSVPGTGLQHTPLSSFDVSSLPGKATLISPSGIITDSTPLYSWNAVAGATWYYLWVNDSSGNKIKKWYRSSEVGCGSGTGTCSITPSTTLVNGNGKWWIKTWNSVGHGPWSSAMSFSLGSSQLPAKATLVSPSGTISDDTPTYIWNAVSGASWYLLWVNDSTGNKIKQWYTHSDAGCSSGTCSVTPPITLVNGNGSWWVQTWNNSGFGPWSSAMNYALQGNTLAKTTLISPAGTITDSTPTFTWNAVSGSTKYGLLVEGTAGDLIATWYSASEVNCGSGAGVCSFTPTTELPNGEMVWQVRTGNDNENGPWSNPINITLQDVPGATTLISPSGTITDSTPTYTWNAVSGSTRYGLLVESSNSGDIIANWYTASEVGCSNGTGTCTITPTTVLPDDEMVWQVITGNDIGDGSWSELFYINF